MIGEATQLNELRTVNKWKPLPHLCVRGLNYTLINTDGEDDDDDAFQLTGTFTFKPK